ncbi:MAG: amino acid adenylation domain-containing protein, partial [Geminicoccaceae bacterium]
ATLSFGELDARADELARHLAGLGVGPDILVGVAMRRSPELLVGFLAILKAGGAYVPIDADYPTERIAYMIKDANLALVLTDSTMRNRLPLPDGVQAIEIDRLEPAGSVTASVWPAPQPGNLAYLIYTSGSTGRPKGVAVSHGALAMHVRAIGARYRMSPRDCELIFMSFAFDGAHERWLTALAHGASVALRDDSLWTPEQTLTALHRHGVTVAAFPPAYLLQLAEHVERSGTPPPVRTYCFGGDAVPQASFELVQRVLRPEAIINGYGPTETVVTPMIWHAGPNDRCRAVYAPIGDRVGARSVWVLDEDLNPLPPGLTGELYLGGEGLARGYHGRPALTAERFVPDLFDADGSRLYRTGDLVRQRPDGLIDYLGRIDQQVKIRGFRIELGEIEARLAEHGGVREALVVARDGAAGKQLVAYVTGDGRDLADRLRVWLKERLPAYMVPAHILVLDRMPVNANGKLDRNALPDPGQQQRDHEPPRTATERALAAIWQEVLGLERVGITDNFFELGGDSIMTLKVIARLRSQPELGLNLKLRDLMLKPTIAQLCTGQATAPVKAEPDPLLTLNRARAGRRPLFCLHAGFGTVFDYDTLARHLEGEVPVHGLQCRMLLDPAWRDHSIAAMARDYARRIREQQRHGPYRLLGWSLGGSLAIAVAHELEAAGQTVELCGIVDPFVPGEPAPEVAWRDELSAFLEFTVPQAGVPDPALLGGLHDAGDLPALQELIERHVSGSPAAGPDTEELAQLFAVAGRLRMLAGAMPSLPAVTVAPISFWLPGRVAARRQFFEQIGRQGEMHEIDSTHFSILREPALVDVVAQALAATLAPS